MVPGGSDLTWDEIYLTWDDTQSWFIINSVPNFRSSFMLSTFLVVAEGGPKAASMRIPDLKWETWGWKEVASTTKWGQQASHWQKIKQMFGWYLAGYSRFVMFSVSQDPFHSRNFLEIFPLWGEGRWPWTQVTRQGLPCRLGITVLSYNAASPVSGNITNHLDHHSTIKNNPTLFMHLSLKDFGFTFFNDAGLCKWF